MQNIFTIFKNINLLIISLTYLIRKMWMLLFNIYMYRNNYIIIILILCYIHFIMSLKNIILYENVLKAILWIETVMQ